MIIQKKNWALDSPDGVHSYSIDRKWDMLSDYDMGGLTGAFKYSISTFVNDITSFTQAFLNSDVNNEILVNGSIERMRELGITVTAQIF